MAEPISKKQKLLIEYLLYDREVFVKCIRIAKASYFESPLDRVMEFVINFFEAHHNVPKLDIIEAETGIALAERILDETDIGYFLEEFEEHCRAAAMTEAILASVDYVNEGRMTEVETLVRNALMVRLDNSLGTDLFEDPENRIKNMNTNIDERKLGIGDMDLLTSNIRRGELGVVFGSTSAGKSVMLANIADKLASQELNVFVISLELNEELYSKRLDAIVAGVDIASHALLAAEIAEALGKVASSYGKITTKKMPFGTTPSEMRALVMEYHLKYGFYPDALVVDYLGLMGGIRSKGMNKFDEDEIKAFGIRDICVDYNMYGFTAGQINRDGYNVTTLGPQHVAGGISVINAADWAVGIVATEEDIDNNQIQGVQMKVRNGGKTTKPIILYRCPKTLRLSGKPFIGKVSSPVVKEPHQDKKAINPAGEKTGKDKLRAALKLGGKK